MTAPNDPQSQLPESGQPDPTQPTQPAQPTGRPQPGWQPQPSWEPQHGWDQPPITEVTSAFGDEEPLRHEEPATAQYYSPPTPAAGYPPGGYLPGGYPPPTAGYPDAQPARPRRRTKSWILGVALAVLLLVLGGGSVAAFQVLNGGGTQPDQVVPANAIAFAKLDLNPSASQKIAAARFLHRIPKLGGGFGGGSSDWRKAIFDALSANGSLPGGVDFDHDVKPWLGKRAAVVVLPTLHDGNPEVLLVLQSTDDAKARVGISHFGSGNGVSLYRGYAVIGENQQIADQAVADAKAANLADSARYSADMKQLGSLGVSSGWADIGAVSKLLSTADPLGGASPLGLAASSGRLAYTVRLSPHSADLIGKFYGSFGAGVPANQPDLGGLPANTAIAVGMATNPAALDRAWQHYEDVLGQLGEPYNDPSQSGMAPDPLAMVDSLQQQFGIQLPSDLETLVGTGVTAAVSSDGLNGDMPRFVVQSHTDPAAATNVMDHVRQAVQAQGSDFPVQYRATSNGLILGDDAGYLAAVSSSSGPRLAGMAAFRQALPDRAGAQYTAFANLDAIATSMRTGGASQDDLQAISAFSAAGLTVRISGSTATLHVRLLAH
ncbi:MAG TPA: DUF3352 domain-containing protein [Jatrophihabitans sp.]|nr:DUF3352 domain-containing protein [Jatrophihabitans sp.]